MLVSKNFGDIVTFSRASSGWAFSSGGVLMQSAAGVPRFDYDPITLAARGLLLEEAGTNLCLYSSNMANVVWNKSNCVISTDGRLAPDGTSAAQLLTVSTTAFTNLVQTVGAVASGDSRVFRIWLSAGTVDTLMLGIYDGSWTGTGQSARIAYGPGAIAQSVGARYSVSGLSTTEWTLVEITRTGFSGATAQVFIYPRNAGSANAGDSLYLWGADVKSGINGTSHVPTTSAQATRAADSAVISDLSKIGYNPTEGTVYAEFVVPQIGGSSRGVLVFSDGTATTNRLVLYMNNGGKMGGISAVGGVYAVSMLDTAVLVAGSVAKVALAYKANDFSLVVNGGVPVTASSGEVPPVNQMRLGTAYGNGTGEILNSQLRRVNYVPKRDANSTMQANTR
ncbi:phage head spike fiber domain-containing protein [Cupriavidus malaysiensis]|uniref:DUF2793 domain-containing protein n=1 Tax=Cupriavidus malaysiensis TaxID=367825 RepID=A0ABN4TQB8_9BURK|nr:hypothetical protein [Cupriavidus malaysiensis]AOZ06756.1 hypothetical protein BKK80_13715 [Cupriavidus malaysiensis]